MPGGSSMEPHDGPLLPAATTVMMPAARCASTAACRSAAEHPSDGGHPHELIVTCGARDGSPCAGVPPTGYGARNHSKHSRYVEGLPTSLSMLRQPIQRAPGAMPIWLAPPSLPTAVPVVCVP